MPKNLFDTKKIVDLGDLMSIGKIRIRILIVLLLLLLLLTACGKQSLFPVSRVIDGDTIEVWIGSSKEKVRLIGVDTPETKAPQEPVEPYGPEAALFTKKLVEGKSVRLEFDVQERDKYGRILAYVYLPDGTFVNAELLRKGYAKVLTIPPNVKYVDFFIKLERKAREEGRGMWALKAEN